jgi:hypothetical protein
MWPASLVTKGRRAHMRWPTHCYVAESRTSSEASWARSPATVSSHFFLGLRWLLWRGSWAACRSPAGMRFPGMSMIQAVLRASKTVRSQNRAMHVPRRRCGQRVGTRVPCRRAQYTVICVCRRRRQRPPLPRPATGGRGLRAAPLLLQRAERVLESCPAERPPALRGDAAPCRESLRLVAAL